MNESLRNAGPVLEASLEESSMDDGSSVPRRSVAFGRGRRFAIDVLLSNGKHHVDTLLPVMREILSRDPDVTFRVLSLCRFRGLASPIDRFADIGASVSEVLPVKFRTSPGVANLVVGGTYTQKRSVARRVFWHVVLKWRVKTLLRRRRPDLVVTPNDGAYPYLWITAALSRKGIPFLLVQEGIKFRYTDYGKGKADALALWGRQSAPFFLHQGNPEEKIFYTGNPRFDVIRGTDWRPLAEATRADHRLGKRNLLFLSNPIDDLGYATLDEKKKLVLRFAASLEPLFADPEFHLIIKLHNREQLREFQELISRLSYASRISVLRDAHLYPLFALSDAAVVFGSSTGLEALLFDLPLGVLEIPGHGFLYDFVDRGAALGLRWSEPMAEQVKNLMQSREIGRPGRDDYLSEFLACRDGATGRVVDVIDKLLGGASP